MFSYPANNMKSGISVIPTSVTTSSTDINGAAFDLADTAAAVLVTVYATALGAGAAAWLVETSEDGSTGWTTVSASQIVDPATGLAATFTGANTSALVNETLAVKTEQLARYIRVTVDPTAATGSFTAFVVAARKVF